MAALSIRDLDDSVRDKLRLRAAKHGRSMEAEVREILTAAANEPEEPKDLFTALLDTFGALGGVELDIPPRTELPRAVEFEE